MTPQEWRYGSVELLAPGFALLVLSTVRIAFRVQPVEPLAYGFAALGLALLAAGVWMARRKG